MPTQTYYVVFKGWKQGIYDSLPKCQKQVNGFKGNAYQSYKSLLDVETSYNEYRGMSEKLPETSNMVETTKCIVETCEKRVQTEMPACDKAVQFNKARNDCSILPILSIICCILGIMIAIYIFCINKEIAPLVMYELRYVNKIIVIYTVICVVCYLKLQLYL